MHCGEVCCTSLVAEHQPPVYIFHCLHVSVKKQLRSLFFLFSGTPPLVFWQSLFLYLYLL